LALPDEAFHPTVLTLWRNRLRAPDDRERIFNAIRAVITESGVLTGKTRRAIDSTVLDDAVARQDTVSMLVTQIRRVRRLVPGLRGVWVREHNLDGGRPPCDWDDPADIDRLVSELVDATRTSWSGPQTTSTWTRPKPTQSLCWRWSLARTWNRATGRASGGSPSAPPRTGSFQPWTPRPATPTRPSTPTGTATKPMSTASPTPASSPATTTPGNSGDAEAAPGLLDGEPEGTEVLGDSAYGTGDLRAHLHDQKMTATTKPPPLRPAIAGGYIIDDFTIDETAGMATCPNGITVTITGARAAGFRRNCTNCPVRHRSTTATAGSSTSTPTTTCSPRPERTLPPPISKPPTGNIDP
jgi:IS5 family transposase